MTTPSSPGPEDQVLPVDADETNEEATQALQLEVEVKEESACERHFTVTVSGDDIERYFDREFSEIMPEAQVPGFRPGRAPRKLVEARFRKDVSDRVKSNLVLDSITQVTEEKELSAISEPDFDFDAVKIPDEGAMTFEFKLEVRPDFDLPDWKGLKIERPARDFSDEDIDLAVQRVLERDGELVDREGAAEMGDYITTKLTFSHDGEEISSADAEVIRIRPTLSFHDGTIENFGEKTVGAKAGDTVELTTTLSEDAPNEKLRGQEVTATFEITGVQNLQLPELDDDYLESLGGFESEADLRDAVLDTLNRQMEYEQHQRAREQILAELTKSADWELPPALLERQANRELQRSVMELQRSGFPEDQIRTHINLLRQNSLASTARSLKEHFILERIAEAEEIEDSEMDYEIEMSLMAAQTGESARRVRARLEKSGGMDALRNQIIERKVIAKILDEAKFEEVPYEPEMLADSAIDRAAGGGEKSEIPEASEENAGETDTNEGDAE